MFGLMEEHKRLNREAIRPLLKTISNDIALRDFRKNSSFFIGKPEAEYQWKMFKESEEDK